MIEKLRQTPAQEASPVGLPAAPIEPGGPPLGITEEVVVFEASPTGEPVDPNELPPKIKKRLNTLLANNEGPYTRVHALWILGWKDFKDHDYKLIAEIREKHNLDKLARGRAWQWPGEALTELVEASWRDRVVKKESAEKDKKTYFKGSTKEILSFLNIATELGYSVANTSLTNKIRGAAQDLGIEIEEGKKARFIIDEARQICEALRPNPGSTRNRLKG